MPWWSWLIIWSCLVLALLAVLVISAWRLFRKAVAVFDELGRLAEKTDLLGGAAAEIDENRAELAVLQKYSDVQAHRQAVREQSEARREARHVARLARARALTRFDANSRRWFEAD